MHYHSVNNPKARKIKGQNVKKLLKVTEDLHLWDHLRFLNPYQTECTWRKKNTYKPKFHL